MKCGQIPVYCIKNISNMFLAQCWKLEASSRPFYYFIKMAVEPVDNIDNRSGQLFSQYILKYFRHYRETTNWSIVLFLVSANFFQNWRDIS